ncbi:hypothetical protein OF385_14210 [Glutamicibacter sp. JL.03c]|uniref:hypothetical protein n=1 Tax=Glutamicibacter sp. JL.03c TaxID=2984842 RepID=UPI0021F71A8E|nr:hypothetical protein [Glutamicibacter sp. JL.03c]UYQ77159.1 hypothetical protein OF385_14210 [Glutamicibacter sp. JL.03c]
MPKPLKFTVFALVLLMLGISAQSTAASWRAESIVDPPALKTGSLSLLAGGSVDYPFATLSGSGLVPGSFTQAPLVISNAGSVDLAYRLNGAVNTLPSPSASDQALFGSLQLSVYSGMDSAACEADQALAGVQLYRGAVGANASFATARVLRAEPAAASETLCVRLSLPAGATQGAAGGKAAVTLTFAGQQG